MHTKTALLTGAATRIGAAIARALHADGMNVVVHYFRSAAAANALCDSLNAERGGSASVICADLLASDAYQSVIADAHARHGRLDVLINNASAFFPTTVGATSSAQWDELLVTNLKAPYFLSQAAAPALRDAGGCIVNLADIHAERPLRNYGVYSIAKAGMIMLTKVLAKELAPQVRVNAVSPGAVLWPDDLDEGLRQRVISQTMLKRAGDPDDVVRAVRFLIRDADYVTGQVLTVDGGRTLYS